MAWKVGYLKKYDMGKQEYNSFNFSLNDQKYLDTKCQSNVFECFLFSSCFSYSVIKNKDGNKNNVNLVSLTFFFLD